MAPSYEFLTPRIHSQPCVSVPPDSTPTDFFRNPRWKTGFDEEILAAARPMVPKVREMHLDEPTTGSFSLV